MRENSTLLGSDGIVMERQAAELADVSQAPAACMGGSLGYVHACCEEGTASCLTAQQCLAATREVTFSLHC